MTDPEDADDALNVKVIESGDSRIILAHPPQADVPSKKRKQPAITDFLRKSK